MADRRRSDITRRSRKTRRVRARVSLDEAEILFRLSADGKADKLPMDRVAAAIRFREVLLRIPYTDERRSERNRIGEGRGVCLPLETIAPKVLPYTDENKPPS